MKLVALLDKSKKDGDHKKHVCVANLKMKLAIPRGESFKVFVKQIEGMAYKRG